MALSLLTRPVLPAWVDYNGHMNDAAYALLFSHGVEALMAHLGLDERGRGIHEYTIFTLETHLCYLQQVQEDVLVNCDMQLLASDAKRLHVFFTLTDDKGARLATSEQLLMGIDIRTERPAAFPGEIAARVAWLPDAEPGDWPDQAGRRIEIRRRK
ncbi:thioesterase family protein [Kushneria indalinina]|uniref:Acyl-CoA thioester hydrolase n=1 Tax=Kushneria indalinina DSM 14324 TaxID=1122140 RepID=A0A3D9DU99_9GAMM|nr:thioesterase family protein [Kushneria indalinina]REC94307.1 acyl-CoA thioester hydrolase [Kushneria indalinina DSM 14324]